MNSSVKLTRNYNHLQLSTTTIFQPCLYQDDFTSVCLQQWQLNVLPVNQQVLFLPVWYSARVGNPRIQEEESITRFTVINKHLNPQHSAHTQNKRWQFLRRSEWHQRQCSDNECHSKNNELATRCHDDGAVTATLFVWLVQNEEQASNYLSMSYKCNQISHNYDNTFITQLQGHMYSTITMITNELKSCDVTCRK